MDIVVKKYGGTSVGSIGKIVNVARNIIQEKKNGRRVIVVVSAMGSYTDVLIDRAKSITKTPDLRELDVLLSTGEQQTISLLAMTLKDLGYDTISLTGHQAGIKTSGIHTRSKICDIDGNKLKKLVSTDKIVVIPGFQGVNERGDITTLGRGGSDTTAVAIAAKLGCSCEIYTDVDGVYMTDPKLYKEARKIGYINYDHMIQMSELGAKVLETRAVKLAKKYNVPLYIGLSDGKSMGTYVGGGSMLEENKITGLVINDDIFTISIDNIPNESKKVSRVLNLFKKYEININMINRVLLKNDTIGMTFICKNQDSIIVSKIEEELIKEFENISILKDCNSVRISVVGTGINNEIDTLDKVFKIFVDNNIDFKQITNSEISLSYLINREYKFKILDEFIKVFNL